MSTMSAPQREPFQQSRAIRFTKEEDQFIRNCLRNSLWALDLPSVLCSGVFTKVAMNLGYLKYSRGGLISVCIGTFIVARFYSYGACFNKLLQTPGCDIQERMNLRRIVSTQLPDPAPGLAVSTEPEAIQQPSYLDMDNDRPDYPGIDASIPLPSVDEQLPSKPSQSYADLRRQNRESYQQMRGPRPPSYPEGPSSWPPKPPQDSPASPSYEPPQQTTPRQVRVNKYGDVWDE